MPKEFKKDLSHQFNVNLSLLSEIRRQHMNHKFSTSLQSAWQSINIFIKIHKNLHESEINCTCQRYSWHNQFEEVPNKWLLSNGAIKEDVIRILKKKNYHGCKPQYLHVACMIYEHISTIMASGTRNLEYWSRIWQPAIIYYGNTRSHISRGVLVK